MPGRTTETEDEYTATLKKTQKSSKRSKQPNKEGKGRGERAGKEIGGPPRYKGKEAAEN